jgi:hypothetical protein
MVARLQKVLPEDLTEDSVLQGSPGRITATLKRVESVGFEEVVLYFNVDLKPHTQVKEEMREEACCGKWRSRFSRPS